MQIRLTRANIVKGVLILFLAAFIGYFLSYYKHSMESPHPKMTLIIKYKQVPPIVQEFPRVKIKAYYRGLYVGQVSKIQLSDDQKYILFYLNIYYDKLKLPKNTYVELNTEDLYGARHFALYYPSNPSSMMLKDGDVICGDAVYERIDKFLVRDMQNGKTGKLISNLVDMTDSLKNITNNISAKDSQNLITAIRNSGTELQFLLRDFSRILSDPQMRALIKSSSGSMRSLDLLLASKELNQVISESPVTIARTMKDLGTLNENMPKMNQSLDKTNSLLPEVNGTVSATNGLLTKTNCNLDSINCKVPQIPEIPPEIFFNANKALMKTNCLLDEVPEILSQRYLGLKFIFGQPAASLKRCGKSNLNCP